MSADRYSDLVQLTPNLVLRFVLELFAIGSLAYWGFALPPFPANIAVGILAPVAAAVLWGLFRAPRARFPQGPVVRAIVEVIVMGAGAGAWMVAGHPMVALVFAVGALVSGAINLRAEERAAGAGTP